MSLLELSTTPLGTPVTTVFALIVFPSDLLFKEFMRTILIDRTKLLKLNKNLNFYFEAYMASAIETALNMALALLSVSLYSSFGTESATTPAPD